MPNSPSQTVCWTPVWNKKPEGIGLEHLLLGDRVADSVVLAFDEEIQFFLNTFRPNWMPGLPLCVLPDVVAGSSSAGSSATSTSRRNDA
jgi:uncharacterized protein